MQEDFLRTLRCPITGSALHGEQKSIANAEGYVFPETEGIPWLFADAQAQLWQWRGNAKFHMQSTVERIAQLKEADRDTTLSELARKRVARRLQAEIDHLKQLEQLLKPLSVNSDGDVNLSRTMGAKLPVTQGLSSYYDNIHRDWGWDDEVEEEQNENTLSANLVKQVVPDDFEPGLVAVLGSGAARLAYDLHRAWQPSGTLNVDINPLLTFAAKRIVGGKSVKLYEFPIAPRDLAAVAVGRKLKAPGMLKDGFSFLFADAMDPPFADASLDTVVTPWFLDIVPQDMHHLMPRINRILKPGGVWINLGSTAFAPADPGRRYTPEEVLAAVAGSGFRLVGQRYEVVPYMCSPASCHGRRERVLTFAATKTEDVPQPEAYQYLPEWLRDVDKAVPKAQDIAARAGAHQVYFGVLQLVDGQRSIRDIAGEVAAKYGMNPDEAVASVTRFMTTIYEEGRQGSLT